MNNIFHKTVRFALFPQKKVAFRYMDVQSELFLPVHFYILCNKSNKVINEYSTTRSVRYSPVYFLDSSKL